MKTENGYPEPGVTYEIRFPRRPDLGAVRVRVLGADQETPRTPCGAGTVPIAVLAGKIPKNVPGSEEPLWIGPGDLTAIPPAICSWVEVPVGGAA